MDALILNSGIGSRIRGVLGDQPKGLLELPDGKPLLIHQIETILAENILNIYITTGYKAEDIITRVDNYFGKFHHISFIYNPQFDSTNYIYSIYLSLSHLKNDIIIMHGDLYFSQKVMSEIINQDYSLVTVDSTEPLSEKDFKAKIINGHVKEISTTLKCDYCINCQPLYRLNKADWLIWANNIRYFCESEKINFYAEDALNEVLHDMKLYPYDLLGDLCMEIDTPEDLIILQERLHSDGKK